MNPRSDTKTIIAAMKYLSEDIESNDGVANAAIAEAAERLQELLDQKNKIINDYLFLKTYSEELQQELKEAQDYADELVNHKDMVCLPADLRNLRDANGYFAEQNGNLKNEVQELMDENTHLLQYIKILQGENELLAKRNESLSARTSKNDRRIWL